MRIALGPINWKAVKGDTHYELVRCAFYLGYNIHRVRAIVTANDQHENAVIIKLAHEMGIKEEDKVFYDPDSNP